MVKRALFMLGALAAAMGVVSQAAADGEAGIVIDYGGTIRTECVAFEGDSITGEDLLRAAGSSFAQFGGGARALCSLDGVGCSDASSFDSCFCECKSGSGSCTYWAFFIQRYGGAWQYSTVGFNLAAARDGDLHGWKWGSGSLQSAPPPAGTTFEDVCGHSPNGGAPPSPTVTSTTQPTPSATPTPAPTGGTTTTPAASATAPGTPAPSTSPAAETATPGESPAASPPASSTATAPPVRETPAPVTVTMTAAADSKEDGGGGGSPVTALAGFGAVAAALAGGIAFATMRSRRRGD